ncbi:MAG: FMN-binding protein [Bacillota bacterium]|nr:FMN-binding protein [Bacillota bacterium]
MKVWIKRIMIVVILIAVMVPFAYRGIRFYQYQMQMGQLVIGEIRPEALADGIYTGQVDVVLIQAEVAVEIEDGVIRDIQLEHRHDRGGRAEVIIRSVIEEQSLQVDMITGATDSSKVILKAIENALSE